MTTADLSNAAFPFGTAQTVDIGGVRTLMSRISYVGELGWEIYAPMEQGLRAVGHASGPRASRSA